MRLKCDGAERGLHQQLTCMQVIDVDAYEYAVKSSLTSISHDLQLQSAEIKILP